MDFNPIIEHVRREWSVLKGAPIAVLIFVLFGIGAAFAFEEWHYSGATGQLSATIQSKQALIDQLQEELKGASPQLAALQSRRLAGRQLLLQMYVQSSKFMEALNNVMYKSGTGAGTRAQFEEDVSEWDERNVVLLRKQFGDAFVERYRNLGAEGPGKCSMIDSPFFVACNIAYLRNQSLSVLVETAAYDN